MRGHVARRGTAGLLASVVFLAACGPDSPSTTGVAPDAGLSLARAGYHQAGVHRQYGPPVQVGNGQARAYVVVDAKHHQAPLELGIALTPGVLDAAGLPTTQMSYAYLLPLPHFVPAPYQVIELDWNPMGHPPPGIYTFPHFDFHFYTISLAERNSIVPSNPDFAAEADNLPTGDFVPVPYMPLTGPGLQPHDVAVPQMGVHWFNPLSPEFNGQPFTQTFIYGSWNGRMTFFEPMITLAYLQTKPNTTTSIPVPLQYPEAGYFPTAYKVTYDAQAKEYRVALIDFQKR
ncbi:MAG TPA: hypothetical protein VFW98_02250 [Gemmatimonadaceae bacterium]|nr:hypothetical protein [Gemmatimonadaceae bacterium]